MNRTFTSLPASRPLSFIAYVAIIGCTLLSISATSVSAQTTISASTTAMVPASDLQHDPTWKMPANYSAVLTTERANTALILATPNLKDAKVALYTGYDRMLGYMQVDMAAGLPIESIALKNFNRVNQEMQTDLLLKKMEAGEFSALYDALLVKLTQ